MKLSRWLRIRASIFLWIMGFIRRMTIGVRAALFDGDKVLLIRHSYVPGWHLPGGGVDPGETIEEGLARELVEETGYRLTGTPQFFGHYLNVIPPARDHVALFVCREFNAGDGFTPNNEIVEMGWFSVDNLPPETSTATRQRVEEILGRAERAPYWRD